VVIYQRALMMTRADTLAGEPLANARVAMEVNSGLVLREAVRAGLGLAELPVYLAENDPRLKRVWPDRAEHYDIWMVLHGDLHRSGRVRAVADAIVDVFAANPAAAPQCDKKS